MVHNVNEMDDIRSPGAYEDATEKPHEKLLAELNLVKSLHHQDLIVGFMAIFDFQNEELFEVEYHLDWNKDRGWNASIIISYGNIAQSQMSIPNAYRYIRLGSSIRASRNLMKHLPWD